MNHSKARARLNDYFERTLPPERRAEVASHLKECSRCAGELAELEATVNLLRRLPTPEPPPAMAASVMARVRDGEAERPGLFAWFWNVLQPSVAAPIAAGMMGLALFIGAERGVFEQEAVAEPIEIAVVVPEPAPMVASEPAAAPRVGLRGSVAPEGRGLELAGSEIPQRARHRFERQLRRLRGAGHPHSPWMASHLVENETAEPTNLALASHSRRRR